MKQLCNRRVPDDILETSPTYGITYRLARKQRHKDNRGDGDSVVRTTMQPRQSTYIRPRARRGGAGRIRMARCRSSVPGGRRQLRKGAAKSRYVHKDLNNKTVSPISPYREFPVPTSPGPGSQGHGSWLGPVPRL